MAQIHLLWAAPVPVERVFDWLADPVNLAAAPPVFRSRWARDAPGPGAGQAAGGAHPSVAVVAFRLDREGLREGRGGRRLGRRRGLGQPLNRRITSPAAWRPLATAPVTVAGLSTPMASPARKSRSPIGSCSRRRSSRPEPGAWNE